MTIFKLLRSAATPKHIFLKQIICKNLSTNKLKNSVVLLPSVLSSLREVVGEKNVSTSVALRQQCSQDESHHRCHPSDAVIFPQCTDHVSHCARICYENDISIIPYGTGTGLEGGISAPEGGVTFNLSQMDRVLEVNTDDFDCTVQPGVTRKALQAYIHDTGLWFPVDPGADASLCGMAATSASGTNAVRYGTMRENVLNLQVVLADGRILHTAGAGHRSRKTSAGYNLTNLFIGSEGTLGIITEATLKLHGIPSATVAAVCQFNKVEEAIEATVMILQSGISIAKIEFLDSSAMKACNAYNNLRYRELPTLFLEFNGSESAVQSQAKEAGEILIENGGSEFEWAKDAAERQRLWTARHNAFYAMLALKPNNKVAVTDVCVPISRLPEIIVETAEELHRSSLQYSIVGHVGDGNFHALIINDPNDAQQREKLVKLSTSMSRRALAVGGTCTGEHGIGLGKKHTLLDEIGKTGIDIMKQIKATLDPKNIMNPGKVL